MATGNIVPRSNGEGSIGTSSKAWGNGYFKNLNINGGGVAPIDSPAFTGTPTAPTPTVGDDSGKLATTEFVQDAVDTAVISYATTSDMVADTTLDAGQTTLTKGDSSAFDGDSAVYGVRAKVTASETTDSTTAYSKTVPSNVLSAKFSSIGGRTLAWNQLAKDTLNGEVTINTNTAEGDNYYGNFSLSDVAPINGHKYYIKYNAVGVSPTFVSTALNYGNYGSVTPGGGAQIQTANVNFNFGRVYSTTNGDCVINIKSLKIIDLTLMFGSGNEPSTVAEFEAMFGADFYPYNEGELLSAGVTNVVSRNGDIIDNYVVPAEVRALEGYGWSAGSVKNEIDFVNKKFIKRVGSVDLGTLTWAKVTTNTIPVFTSNAITNAKPPAGTTYVANILTQNYVSANYVDVFGGTQKDKTITMIFAGSAVEKSIYVADSNSSYTDATTFKSAMNGVMLYYELATPIETDITAYLTTDTVQTIPSGTIEFANQNGEDYKIPVPSTEKWQVGDTDSDRTVLLDNGKVAEKLLVAGDKAPLESPFFVGKPQAPNPMVGDVSNQIATTQWVYDIVRKLEERIASLE